MMLFFDQNFTLNILKIFILNVIEMLNKISLRLKIMITHSLSEREKQAIDAILSQAEEEYLQIPSTSIEKIDDQCRSLWPDWDPNSIRNKQEETDNQQIKRSNNTNNAYTNPKQSSIQFNFDDIQDIQIDRKKEATKEVEYESNDMKILRKEHENLMSRINQTVEVENSPLEPENMAALNKMQQIRRNKPIQVLYPNDDISASESGKEEIRNKKKKRTKKTSTFSSSSSVSTETQENQLSIIRPKNRSQAKQVIASTSRELKVVESENQMLKKRLADMEISFNEAQKEIKRLKDELRKSEAIRAKLTSTSAGRSDKKPMKPRKKLELVNRF